MPYPPPSHPKLIFNQCYSWACSFFGQSFNWCLSCVEVKPFLFSGPEALNIPFLKHVHQGYGTQWFKTNGYTQGGSAWRLQAAFVLRSQKAVMPSCCTFVPSTNCQPYMFFVCLVGWLFVVFFFFFCFGFLGVCLFCFVLLGFFWFFVGFFVGGVFLLLLFLELLYDELNWYKRVCTVWPSRTFSKVCLQYARVGPPISDCS